MRSFSRQVTVLPNMMLMDYDIQLSGLSPNVLALAAAGTVWVVYKVAKAAHSRSKATKLLGPPSPSLVFGITRHLTMDNSERLYEEWSEKYGNAFEIPTIMGSKRTVLFDPRAVNHYFSKDTYVYVHSADRKKFIKQLVSLSIHIGGFSY